MFLQICEGVKAFHEATPEPLAHRDLKTSNIVIADDRTPIIMDLDFLQKEETSSQHKGGGPNEETSSHKDVEISPNTLEDNEPFLGFKVNDDPSMLDIVD
uniref:(California timema) hypothetical protein n=1 Tax=Timema californicum TaxID=61474 RepID=A0A7R9J176_TIMCA|nr:unnamed protein product [Timema californicum]